jgi:hypothetical protein
MEEGRPQRELQEEVGGSIPTDVDLAPADGVTYSVSAADEARLLAEEFAAVALKEEVSGSTPDKIVRY